MRHPIRSSLCLVGVLSTLVTVSSLMAAGTSEPHKGHRTTRFEGAKANTGYAIHTKDGKTNVLTLSEEFKVPDTPAPHWQVVDSKGNVYLLNRLQIKGDMYNKSIKLPAYIHDIAKVQIWCSWAEALLGEASFQKSVN